ncbi:Luc7l3, partial [Symbiodinium sp. KB8]
MTEAARTLLDRLMGVNRNEDNEDALITDLHDERVCKDFLCGLCPNDLFVNTKEDVGPCQLRHDENLKRMYEERKAKGEEFPFERYHLRTMSRWLDNLERRIQKAQDRLVGTGEGPAPVIDVESGQESNDLNAEISDVIKEAEEAAESGDVTKSMQLMEKAEELKAKRNEAQARAILETAPNLQGAMSTGQKLRVCNVCGALLSIFDSDKRLADHFSGKQHIGYMKIRARYNELKEKFSGGGGDGGPAP